MRDWFGKPVTQNGSVNIAALSASVATMREKQFMAHEPEKLPGGGFLRFCDLFAQGYRFISSS